MKKKLLQIISIALIIGNVFTSNSISYAIKQPKNKQQANRQRFLSDASDYGLQNSQNSMYLLEIKIGKQEQKFNVQLDTGSYVLWFASKDCEGCGNSYPNRLSSCQNSDNCNLQTDKDKIGNLEFGDGTTLKGTKGYVQMKLPDGITILDQHFLYVTYGEKIVSGNEDGILGLGPIDDLETNANKNWVNILFDNNLIPKNQFSLYLDNGNSNDNSQLILGEIDQKFIKSGKPIHTHLVTSNIHWNIKSTKVMAGDVVLAEADTTGFNTLIDSGTSLMALPTEMLQKLKDTLIKIYKMTNKKDTNIFLNSCDSEFPTLTFILPNSDNEDITYTLEPEFYVLYDSDEDTCGFLISEDESIILGDTFMRKYYSTFIYGQDNYVQLAESITEGIPFAYHSNPSKGFPLWAKIVIPIASVLLLSVIIFFIVRYIRKRKLTKQPELEQSNVSEVSIQKPLN